MPERIFFGGMAILLCVIVYIGFSPTYFGAGMLAAPLPSPILHFHGAVFTLWMLVYLVQSALIPAGKVAWHRSFGIAAFCLPPVMIVLGTIAAVDALHRKVMIGPLDPATSFSIPTLGMLVFIGVIYQAWATRRRPDAHKRLIVIATIGLSEAALGRIPWERLHMAPPVGRTVALAVLLLLMVGYDLFALRRVHRSTIWAGSLTFAVGVVSVPIGMTPAWHALAGVVDRYL
jgi:hypothetical protein